jgi:hypothetical protein
MRSSERVLARGERDERVRVVEGPSLLVWSLAAVLTVILVLIRLFAGEPPWFWVFLPLMLEAGVWVFMIALGMIVVAVGIASARLDRAASGERHLHGRIEGVGPDPARAGEILLGLYGQAILVRDNPAPKVDIRDYADDVAGQAMDALHALAPGRPSAGPWPRRQAPQRQPHEKPE